MIDLYYWPTGNGKKISIMLEECALEYRVIPINIAKGDQFSEEFLKISPNNKMPAIVDHDVVNEPISLFESGAILQYLAEKAGKFLPQETRKKYEVLQWLYWQVGGLGPMGGQAHYFLHYSPKKVEYAMDRCRKEMNRIYSVMNDRLSDNEYLAKDYSIADISAWPWVFRHDWQEQDLNDFPNVKRWFESVAQRPAVKKGSAVGSELMDMNQSMSQDDKKKLFNISDKDFANTD